MNMRFNPLQLKKTSAFTLVELLVVLAILALLLTLATPRYFKGVEKAKEATLRQDLNVLRETLDKFYGDQGRYPDNLDELVRMHYIRAVPIDPITESQETWTQIAPEPPNKGQVYDIRSGAVGNGLNGVPYQDW